MHVKKNDSVIVLSGKDKGKSGKILRALPKENKVVVEGVNVRKVFEKKAGKKGGAAVEKPFPLDASNVKLKK